MPKEPIVISVFYDPDTLPPSVDKAQIKRTFRTQLSSHPAHQAADEKGIIKLQKEIAKLHTRAGQAVFLCASYYSYERWTQDAVRMSREVSALVYERLLKPRPPVEGTVLDLDVEEDFGHGLVY